MSNVSRRDFLKAGAATLASITVAPSSILGKSFGHIPPSDKLNIAAIGVGGIGHSNINAVKDTENLVALCDVDWNYAKGVFDEFPKAKNVYCQKPLTHSVYESRLLTKLAESTGVVTQMGNQGASGEGTDLVCEWIWNGEIGDVVKVECATDRPIWPQGLNSPEKEERIPKTLDWDLFTGESV